MAAANRLYVGTFPQPTPAPPAGLSFRGLGYGGIEHRLLERLSAEAKVTALTSVEINMARALEKADLVFFVPDGSGGAVITPRGRRLLAELESTQMSAKKPLGCL